MSQPDDESVTFVSIGDHEIAHDPFQNTSEDAGDAAFLLGGFSAAGSLHQNLSTESNGSVSLLERIQQQKKQQNIASAHQSSSGGVASIENSSNDQFGYPTAENTTYFASTVSPPQPIGVQMNIPDYSTSMNRPDPFTNSSNSNVKDQMFSVLSAVGSAAGSAAKGAYSGSKRLYGNMVKKKQSARLTAHERMAEMDYQRESLLLDPHDVEDGTLPLSMGSTPTGLLGGINDPHSAVSTGRHPIIGYTKHFCLDLKDIFMGLSTNMKLVVIGFVAFLLWLFISEEWPHHEA